MTPGLTLEDVTILQHGQPMLQIDTHVMAGTVLSIMGPSGVGKSTLLAAITGTLPQGFSFTGRILLNGTDLAPLPPDRRRVGLLFQDALLFPHLSVGQNLAFGLCHTIKGRAPRRARVEQALSDIGMAGFADRDPATLSGGQKARVALMRTLLSDPQALLLDEPFSRLDVALRDQIRQLTFDHARARGLPTLLVTHDVADATGAGGPVITLG